MTSASRSQHRSFCRVCTSLCGIVVETEGDRVVGVSGDREHPLSRGYTCPKGRALAQMHHHPQRLEQPRVRVDGTFRDVSWDECLDDLATKLRDIIDRHGPSAVGIYFGSGIGLDAAGYRMAEVLHQCIGTPAKFSPLTIDGTAKVLVSSQVGGFPGFNLRPDYDAAELVIYIGVNPVVSHGHATAMPIPPSRAVQGVAARGEAWVIDPRHNETVRFATRHIAPLPGRDYIILAWLVKALLEEGERLESLSYPVTGVEELRAAVAPFDSCYTASMAGVEERALTDLLASVKRSGRLAVETGTGVTMNESANVTQWLAWVLMILTDSMNRPGGAWFHPGYLTPLDLAPLPVIPAEALFAPGPASRPELLGFMGEWPCAVLPDEINASNIKAFLNLGGNLITAFPDEQALRPALQKLELFASLEIIGNETTALSSHILPGKDQLERPDVTLWDFLSSRISAQYTEAVVAPVGDRRSTWWILAELVHRLGGEVPAHLNGDGRETAADEAAVAAVASHGRQPYEQWHVDGYTEVDRQLPAAWVEDFIGEFGGWRLAPTLLCEQLQMLLSSVQAEPDATDTLHLIPRRQRRHVNAQFTFLGDTPEALFNPGDAVRLNIPDGEQVIIASERGEIPALARHDEGIRAGVVSVPHGFESANVNRLTDSHQTDYATGMARYSGIPVSVKIP